MKVLYVGPVHAGTAGRSWHDAFVELGHDVRALDADALLQWPRSFAERLGAKASIRPPVSLRRRLNDAIVDAATAYRPDLIFLVHARFVDGDAVEVCKRFGRTTVYYNDDMYNRRNRTFTFIEVVRSVDCILTTKSFNVSEFLADGAKRAIFLPNAFDRRCHSPARLSASEKKGYGGDVAFVGTFRTDRADFLNEFAARLPGRTLNVWGGGWQKMSRPVYWGHGWRALRPSVRCREVWCTDMAKAIGANKIALGLLYAANRDLHTCRTFEIPACAGFMLAERSSEHLEYFKEDEEAVYFSDMEELIAKTEFYLRNDRSRRRIAVAGYQRCLRSGYSYRDRAVSFLTQTVA